MIFIYKKKIFQAYKKKILKSKNYLIAPWCLEPCDYKIYDKYKNLLLLNEWDDQKSINKDKHKIFYFYNKTLPLLRKKMNKILNKKINLSFWNLLIGPWLFKFIEYYYDKYLIIEQLKNKIDLKNIKLSNNNFFINSFYDFYHYSQNENFNLYILNQIISHHNNDIKLSKNKNVFLKTHEKKKNFFSFYQYLKNKLIFFRNRDAHNENFINFNLALSSKELDSLSNKKRNLLINFYNSVPDVNINKKSLFLLARSKKIVNKKKLFKNNFLNLINDNILKNIPVSYLENFDHNFNFYRNYCDLSKHNILVRSSTEILTKARFLLSILSLTKNKLYCFQEGGVGKFNFQSEFFKYSIMFCDKFFTWSKSSLKKSNNFFLTKTSWLKKYKINDNKILITLGSVRPFFFSMYEGNNIHFGFSQTKIVTDLIDLLVEKNLSERVILRLHNNYGFGEKKFYKNRYPNILIQDRKDNPDYNNLIDKSQIKIFTSDYTVMTQSFIINHPTILILDLNKFILNSKFKKIYNDLYLNKILFHNSSDCMSHILKINNNVDEWWNSNNVQKSKNRYLDFFCKLHPNFVDIFKKRIFGFKYNIMG